MPKKKSDLKYYEAVGRRKSAVARVRLYLTTGKKEVKIADSKMKKGDIVVNNLPADKYFPGDVMMTDFTKPLALTDSADRFAISIITKGGGKHSQMEAARLGIARALEIADGEHRSVLKPEGLLSRNSRVRERRKAGTGGRARRQKQSPKR